MAALDPADSSRGTEARSWVCWYFNIRSDTGCPLSLLAC